MGIKYLTFGVLTRLKDHSNRSIKNRGKVYKWPLLISSYR
jgi:hypothetical protein